MAFVCSVVLLAGVVRGLSDLDWDSYALETGQIRLRETEFLERSEDVLRSLDRTVIEKEYSAYILDMAQRKGCPLVSVSVQAQWSLEGFWVPHAALMIGSLRPEEQASLAGWIESDLGIPQSRQEWRRDGG
ncbi:MAG: hypothetical protein IKH34_02530 [Oscillospiraceae bacterium]|nr:hypothetical protein [Oscillospiraceae bacterium]